MASVSPHIHAPVKQEVMDYGLKIPKHSTLKEWKKGFVYFVYLFYRISRSANNCGTHSLVKNIFFLMQDFFLTE